MPSSLLKKISVLALTLGGLWIARAAIVSKDTTTQAPKTIARALTFVDSKQRTIDPNTTTAAPESQTEEPSAFEQKLSKIGLSQESIDLVFAKKPLQELDAIFVEWKDEL